MDYKRIHKVYFAGIGGIGMSALARFFKQLGADVSGYDKTETPLTRQLMLEGIRVHYQDQPSMVPQDADLYIYTPAIPGHHKELNFIKAGGFPLYKRSEVLGLLSQNFKTIAVAGTHGKTTISSMITHLLLSAGVPVNAFIGGISTNLNSNFVFDHNAEIMVVEADEYDRSFLKLHPDLAVISSIDEDHLDVYGSGDSLKSSFSEFLAKTGKGGTAIIQQQVNLQAPEHINILRYGLCYECRIKADDIRAESGKMVFRLHFDGGSTQEMYLGLPGKHNIENAVAACALAWHLGLSEEEIRRGLDTYTGVKRRFEILVNTQQHVYVDDYAHHPRELEAAIKAARDFFPGRKITGVFQPHLFTRTRDLACGFAESLRLLDEIILMEIYPARETPLPGISSAMLAGRIGNRDVKVLSHGQVLKYVEQNKPELLMTLGAGDIDRIVEPLKNIMKQ